MLSKFFKSTLVFNRAQNQAPNFFLVYFLIALIWHNNFFMSLVVADGSLSDKFTSALTEHSFQYGVVLCLTLLFYILRLSFLYFVNKTDEFIEADEPIETKIGSDQVFTENKDVVRLLALLDETKAELAKVKVREVTAQKDKTATISKMLAAQAELDIALADITILSKSNEELRSKLSECKVT
ncbi:hypothetical protein [Colwellia sp. Arc7-D]|uniref:hypothetical protein n=1 Tax=Colwellia sp. Arc7-D TaxID=2161872 RepID=UPI000D3C21E9|nr:hypothetical protein [Colwellia sp. Arc7-D]AWB56466.1 hypothetical protein DBO93_02045 [Colwellia sp. Arc7-D]